MTDDRLLPPPFKVGNVEVRRVVEIYAPFRTLAGMFPQDAEVAEAAVEAMRGDLEGWALDPKSGMLILAIQTYVLRTSRHVIVVDTCVGCGKSYPSIPAWHMRTNDRWLRTLAEAGVDRAEVTHVLCTHLHGDHVGWNTMQVDGKWVPTFPNATYLMTATDERFIQTARPETWVESVSPVIAAGQAQLVETDFALDDEVWIEPSPGHTPGHVCVHVRSQGEEAMLTGDAFHSTIQCRHPELRFFSDADPEQAVRTRRAIFEATAETDRVILPAHFPLPTIGHVVRDGEAFGFRFKRL